MSNKPPQDTDAWKAATEQVKPLRDDPQPEPHIEQESEAEDDVDAQEPAENPSTSAPTSLGELVVGDLSGIDGRTAERFRRGRIPIEAMIDLHGNTRLDARSLFEQFVRESVAKKRRVVLVITGKGKESGGVLRTSLPHWINEPHIRPFILAFEKTTHRDGGSGAFYLLLKRKPI